MNNIFTVAAVHIGGRYANVSGRVGDILIDAAQINTYKKGVITNLDRLGKGEGDEVLKG